MLVVQPPPEFQGAPNWATEHWLRQWGQDGWDEAVRLDARVTELEAVLRVLNLSIPPER